MDQTTSNKYIKGFSNELLNFLVFIEELIPTASTQKILSKYEKINTMKIIKRYNNVMNPLKEKLTQRDVNLFSKPLFIIPEFDMSFFWDNLPVENKDHVWETLSRLLIYSNILLANPAQQAPVKVIEKKKDPIKEVNPFIGIGENNTNISVDSLRKEVESGKVDGNPIMKALKDKLNVDELSKQLQNVDKNSISQMTDEVKKIIAPHVDDPQVSGLIGDMLTNIGDELKNSDLSGGNLFETMLQIAEKMSTKLASDANNNKCSPEKLLASTQSIMKSIGLPENMNPNEMMAGIAGNGHGDAGNPMAALMGMMTGGSGGNSDNTMAALMGMMNGMMKK